MKACIVLQNQYAKMGHAIACQLKETHGIERFAAYVYSPQAQEFIATQKDLAYEPILIDHELHARAEEERVDTAYIKYLEEHYEMFPLWQYLYADRKLMMSIGPKEETTADIDPLYDHEMLTKAVQARARAIERILLEFKPDFVVFFAIGALGNLLLYQIAKKLGIRTLNITTPRVGNSMSISEDYRTLTGAEEIFDDLKVDSQKHGEVRKQAQELIEQFRRTGSLQLQYYELLESDLKERVGLLKPRSVFRTLRYWVTLTQNYLRHGRDFTYGEVNQNPLRFLGHKLKRRWRTLRGIGDLASKPDPKDEYVYFPLHYEPEQSTLVMSPFYFDQIALIRQIARSLPLHFKLYIKEHPAMKGRRKRGYYKELLKLPNVKLIEEQAKGFELLKNARLITTITGTAGWEAILLGKPVITFGDAFFNRLSSVKRVGAIEHLPLIIESQLHDFVYDEKEIVAFLAAVLADSFPMDFFRLWYENDVEKLKNNKQLACLCEHVMKKVNSTTQPPYKRMFAS